MQNNVIIMYFYEYANRHSKCYTCICYGNVVHVSVKLWNHQFSPPNDTGQVSSLKRNQMTNFPSRNTRQFHKFQTRIFDELCILWIHSLAFQRKIQLFICYCMRVEWCRRYFIRMGKTDQFGSHFTWKQTRESVSFPLLYNEKDFKSEKNKMHCWKTLRF